VKIPKKLHSSIVLLILGGLIAKTQILFGDGCQGMVEVILFLFLSVIYIFALLIILSTSATKYFKKEESFNYFPLATTLIVAILIYLVFQSDNFESSTRLHAISPLQHSLTLRKNNTFKIQMQEIEWACFYKGNYKLQGDTLTLLRPDLQAKTENIFANKYFIDQKSKRMYPVDNFSQDTTRWLTIIDND